MSGPVGGPGAELPGRRRIFENLGNNFLRKIALFWSIFQIKFQNPALNFRAFGQKTTIDCGNFAENSMEKLNFTHFQESFC